MKITDVYFERCPKHPNSFLDEIDYFCIECEKDWIERHLIGSASLEPVKQKGCTCNFCKSRNNTGLPQDESE